jgi:DNA polymerase elongation subunit (family B)
MSMATLNASPETKVDDSYDGPTYVAPNGVQFRKEPDGVIRDIINELLEERNRKKALRAEHPTGSEAHALYDMQQAAVKVIMVSLYGVMGWDKFRLYDSDVSAAVTATGRATIEFSGEIVNELSYEVTYGDTDSVMIELGKDKSLRQAIAEGYRIERVINSSYDDFAREQFNADENRLEMEFEKLYRTFFQAGKKKRYAGHVVWKDGEQADAIDITGFEYKRSDIPRMVRDVQEEVIRMILHGEEEDIRDYITEVVNNVKSGEIPLEEIGIPSGVGKELDAYSSSGGHILAAKMGNLLLDANIGKGSKPKRVYLERIDEDWLTEVEERKGIDRQRHKEYSDFLNRFGSSSKDPAIAFENPEQIPEGIDIDWEKMLEKTIEGPIGRVLEGINIDWDEIESGQEQTGLGQFT